MLLISVQAPAQQVTFGEKALAAGQHIATTSQFIKDVNTQIKLGGGSSLEEIVDYVKKSQKTTTTILESTPKAVSKLEIHFEEYQVIDRSNYPDHAVDYDTEDDVPLGGKTYVIWQKGQGLGISYEDGKPVPSRENRSVVTFTPVGRSDSIVELFKKKTLSVGQTVALPDEVTCQIFSINEVVIQNASMTLKGVFNENGARVGKFVMNVVISSHKENMGWKWTISGDVSISIASSRMVSAHLQGTVKDRLIKQVDDRLVNEEGSGTVGWSIDFREW
jgi:hypothetical protein